MKDNGLDAVTVSGYEIPLALKTGFMGSQIFYNGVGKQRWEVELAVENGCYLNVDSVFDAELIQDIRHQYIALSDKELDIAVLSKIACGIHLDPTTRKPAQTERKASRTDYMLHGHRICRDFFLYIQYKTPINS